MNLIQYLDSLPVPKLIPKTLQGYNLAVEKDRKEYNSLPEHIRSIGISGILPKSKQI